jgi:ribosome biogenesis GTPase
MILAVVIGSPPRSSFPDALHARTGGRILIGGRAGGQGRPGRGRNSGAAGPATAHTGPMDLASLGWDDSLDDQFGPWAATGHRPGRVTAAHRGGYLVAGGDGELLAPASGRLRHLAGPSVAGLPAVGDWVAVREGRIHAVLPRRTAVTRRQPGSAAGEQVLAANVDLVLVVVAPGRDANPRRVERLLALAWGSGAQPVVVLGRADLCPEWGTDVDTELAGLAAVAPGVEVLALSCFTGEGVGEVAAMLGPGRTAVLLGSSGVGKSTLVNRLAGRDLLATGELRDDGKGRHTTTTRQLVVLAGGGLVIDTPGLRELGLWTDAGGTAAAFEDVEELAAGCRFDDCRHRTEPGCAVKAALEDGRLAGDRFAAWGKLQRELAWASQRADPLAAAERRRHIRAISKSIRAHELHRGRD